jgi:hypothetical protein
MNNATNRGALTLVALLLAASLTAGCENGKPDMPRVEPAGDESAIRNFTAEEIDSLQALKQRNRVTHDEYWDDRGGVLGNDEVEVWYPPGKLTVSHGMYVLDYAMKCRRDVRKQFGHVPDGMLTIICAQTMEAYTEFTGRQWWHYASIEDHRIVYQPVPVLAARGILDIALPRELYEWAIGRVTGGKTPRWMVEGMASFLAAEDAILESNLTEFPNEPIKMSVDEIEAALLTDIVKKTSRFAYYNSLMMVKRLEQEFGQDALTAMLRSIADGASLDDAAGSAFQLTYAELVTRAQDWTPSIEIPQETE